MAVVTDGDPYEKLLSLSAWAAYTREPGGNTLAQLLDDAKAHELEDQVPRALAHLFLHYSHWKVAQHLANVLLESEDVSLALYYAGKAVSLSGGSLWAKLTLARCLQRQCFPEALMILLNEMYPELGAVEPVVQRGLIRCEIVELYVWVFCYSNRPDLAKSWVEVLVRFPRFRVGPIVQWMVVSHRLGYNELAFRAAALLAQGLDVLEEREKMLIRRVARVRLWELLCERQRGG